MDKYLRMLKILIMLSFLMVVLVTAANSFGYDSANACNPNGKLSRRGRAQLLAAIPCDLTKQEYCNLPGSAYPWHAVRRFVHENQGLMKRMYGDVRHISVLRDEIQNNEIDIDDIEIATVRYSRDAGKQRRASKYLNQRVVHSDVSDASGASGTSGSGIPFTTNDNFKSNDILSEPHFRPVVTTTASTITTTTSRATTTTERNPGTTIPKQNISNAAQNNANENKKENNGIETDPITTKILLLNNNDDDINTNIATIDHDDDRNLESNSVYEIATLLAEELSKDQEAVQIVEPPKFSTQGLHNLSKIATISATLKIDSIESNPTMSSTHISILNDSSSVTGKPIMAGTTTTSTTMKPMTTTPHYESTQRRRYQQQQQQQQQLQQHYINRYRPQPQQYQQIYKISNIKENFGIKNKINESEKATGAYLTAIDATIETNATTTTLTNDLKNAEVFNTNDQTGTGDVVTLNIKSHTTLTAAQSTAPTLWSSKPTSDDVPLSEKLRKQPTHATATGVSSTPTPTPLSTPTSAPTPAANAATKPILKDGQLYQDTVKQEPAPVVNFRGVNACPVKEEVVAPFWANNTRGEVLALLNLYPFEQYVHWEKCTHEHKQMYCRDGCRCEQQYRLHRLLAYDPRNECRGIFSDWFRFPSCCICKCYNIPMEFRATSRSPRMSFNLPDDAPKQEELKVPRRHPIEIAEEHVRRAIYEHAADDWYRPQDYSDFMEDDE